MTDRVQYSVKPKLKNELKSVSRETGLTQSEIARRGLVEQLQKLPTEDQK